MKFEQDETVLYRLMLAKIRSIINVYGRSCYLLDSLESDHCQYLVPVENRMDHLQKLPDSASCQALLHRVQDLPMQKITRNAIARSCKSVLEQKRYRRMAVLAEDDACGQDERRSLRPKASRKRKAFL